MILVIEGTHTINIFYTNTTLQLVHDMSHAKILEAIVPYEFRNSRYRMTLECGCGLGIWGYLMRAENRGNQVYIVGVDITRGYLHFCKKHKVYDDLILADISKLPFRSNAFDFTVASEVIEHLNKKRGVDFLDQIETITRNKIILTTPNGNWPTKGATGAERHISEWRVKDFTKRGYKVRGVGLKGFDPERVPHMLCILMRFVFTPISYLLPYFGELLIATKIK